MKRFRVISDLHLDINKEYPFSIEKDGVLTVVAGDTYGERFSISFKCQNQYVGVHISNPCSFEKLFKKRKTLKIVRKGGKWMCGEHVVDNSDGININQNGVYESGSEHKEDKINDGDVISFKIVRNSDWIRKNISNGILVAGNHIVYNRDGLTIEKLKERCHEEYPVDSTISFLDNSVGVMTKEIDGILFIGSTLYTDYKLPSEYDIKYEKYSNVERQQEVNMRRASPKMSGGGMNDFNFGKTDECTYNKAWSLEASDDMSFLTPKNYLNFFNRTFAEMKKIVEENPNKPIVIVTHHCPSPKCISRDYVSSDMNASYVSDLEEFIMTHKNIKCWCCGHVHHRNNFKIGQCLVVMNPLGYCPHGQFRKNSESAYDWTPNLFVNTESWEVEIEPFDNSRWNKKYDAVLKRRERMYKKYGSFFGCFL